MRGSSIKRVTRKFFALFIAPKARPDPFSTVISVDVEHAIHEYLPIDEVVCVLQCVSRSWRSRIGDALRRRFQWDVRYVKGEGKPAHVYLERVARSRVRIRSLYLQDAQDTPALILQAALGRGFKNAVEVLVHHCAGVVNATDAHGSTPLSNAARYGRLKVVEQLLAAPSIDVNAVDQYGYTPLLLAAHNGHFNVIPSLLAAPNIDVNAVDRDGNTPLLHAACCDEYRKGGRRDVVEALLAAPNIDVSAANTHGITPLHFAADCDVAKMLLGALNVDVNAVDRDGNTPLHFAVRQGGRRDVVEALLAAPNIDVNAANTDGRTPLHCAADCDLVKMLLAAPNINVNAVDRYGNTPLHYAVRKGRRHRNVVEALLAAPNIDVDAGANTYGGTPLDIAAYWSRPLPPARPPA